MKIKGIAASPGIAIGRAYLISEKSYCVIKRNIESAQIKKEIQRFKKAVSITECEFKKLKEKTIHDIGKIYAGLFDAYSLILKDPLLHRETIRVIIDEKVNVEYALQTVIDKITKKFSNLDDAYMKDRVRDVQDVGNKIMMYLLGQDNISLKDIQNRVALVAHALHPSDMMQIKKDKVIGFVTDVGGKTSHIVIMSESLKIPSVVGLRTITKQVSPGDLLIIDGDDGVVYINPEPEIVKEYRNKKRSKEESHKKLVKMSHSPAITKCGEKIEITVNIEAGDEVVAVKEYGADGIGLFRTEYMYLNRNMLPTEDEILRDLNIAVNEIYPCEVIIRTIDLGADTFSSYMAMEYEDNPFMGMRGIRLCLAYPAPFKTQLRAILRASVKSNVRLMYPMITCLKEIKSANYILEEVKEELKSEKIDYDPDLKIGVMIETPAAAMDIENISEAVDFLSIGTNDLIQYTMAVDRISETLSYLYNPADISILKLLQRIIGFCKKNNKWLSMCGEMSADPLYTKLLLGMGLRRFSMSGIAIPNIKQIIKNTSIKECEDFACEVFVLNNTEKILQLLNK